MTRVDDIPTEFWEQTFLDLNRMISPWHTLVDPAKFDVHLNRLESLPLTAIGTAHGTATTGTAIPRAFDLLRRAIRMDAAPLPGQADLDALLATAGLVDAPAA